MARSLPDRRGAAISARIRRASSMCRPRMRSIERRIFRGEIRTYFALAFASISLPLSPPPRLSFQGRAALGVMAVGTEGSRGRELTELVPDHRFRDEHGNVLAAIMNSDRVPDHLGHHGRAARPGLDDPLVASTVHLDHLGQEVVIDERALLDRPGHP